MPLYVPLPVCEATPPFEKVMLWDSGMARVRSGEPVCANGWCSEDGEGEAEGVAAEVGGGGGGVESLRLPLLLLLLLLAVRVMAPLAGTSQLWPKSSSSSREILR